MRGISIGVFVVMTMSGPFLVAQPTRLEGARQILMTTEETNRWKAIHSSEDAKAFIDLFWARRDPTPETPRNEFREQFNERADAADRYFSTVRTPGSVSDRGRAYILLGAPHQIGSRAEAPRSLANQIITNLDDWDGTVRGPRAEPAKMTWYYAYDKKPAFIKRKAFEILFIDDRGGGEFEFAKTSGMNPELLMRQAVEAYIVSPHLTKALQFAETAPSATAGVHAFRSATLKKAYDRFRDEQQAPFGSAYLTWGEFVTPQGEGFVPVSLYVSASAGIAAGANLTFFGAVENMAQEFVAVVEHEATLLPSGRDAYVDQSLRLAPGRYTATFGLADDTGQPLVMTTTAMTIRGLDPKATAVSELILSNNMFALAQAQQRTDPFAFGGMKVVPKGDARFAPGDEIWYFLEMRNPGLAPAGVPKVEVTIDIQGKTEQEKTVRWALPAQEIETLPLKGVEHHYGLGMAFPLKDFVPGQYTVTIRVHDMVLQKSYQVEKQFHVIAPAG